MGATYIHDMLRFAFAVPTVLLVSSIVGCSSSHAPASEDAGPRADARPALPADASEHCMVRGAWLCARLRARGEIDLCGEADCIEEVSVSCEGVMWPSGCAPTEAEAEACIAALSDAARLDEPDPPEGFPECALCG